MRSRILINHSAIICLILFAALASIAQAAEAPNFNYLRRQMIFYESFDDSNSIEENNGVVAGEPVFAKGIQNDAFDFSGSKRIHYPMENNINIAGGTILLWAKPPAGNGYGFFDIGGLGNSNSWGIFKNANYLIMEVKNNSNYYKQAWSPTEFPSDDDWHHIAGVWKRTGDTTNFKVSLDGICKNDYDGMVSDSFPDPNGMFYIGWCGWYGYSESIIDEVRIYNYPLSDRNIIREYEQTLEDNMPYFKKSSPRKHTLLVDPNSIITFEVDAVDPMDEPLEIKWFVNNNFTETGSIFHYTAPAAGAEAIRVTATDGVFTIDEEWGVYVNGTDWKIFEGKLMVDGKEFLVKGIDYTPWLVETGPDPRLHNPLPGENDDVTEQVTYQNITYVTDYSGDGIIQMWEVIQFDLETIRDMRINTIRTYAAGQWHDKNMNGVIDRSDKPEEDEIVQGDLPDWVLGRIVNFCEENDMKIILGYWVQEENYIDENPLVNGYQLECNWQDLEVAKDTLARVVNRYGDSPAVVAWGIGNEVHGSWNQFFTWTVDINEYLNLLYDYVRSIDPDKRPIMYAKYIGEDTTFRNLNADIIGINAYIYSSDQLIDYGEFDIPAPAGKAYLLSEFGHIIEQTNDHWNLAKKYAGGCFLEYADVIWKGSGQDDLGVVEEYRAQKPTRYDVISKLYRRRR